MKRSLLIVFMFTYFSCFCQDTDKIVIGNIESITSKILGEQKKIWVYIPNSGNSNTSKIRYPVVYLLDGGAHFKSFVGMMDQLSTINGNMVCPEMIVIGITNNDRTKELTPTHIESDPPLFDSYASKNSGGGEKFMEYLEKELIPYVEAKYPAAPYRVFIGHSLGGLMVMNALYHHTKLFNAYVAIDPGIWWDNRKLFKEMANNITTKSYSGTSLYLAIANTMRSGRDTSRLKLDTSASSKSIRSIVDLANLLHWQKGKDLNFTYKYYDAEDHGSVPLIAEYDALHFLFGYFPLKIALEDYSNVTKAFVLKLEDHFKTISKHLGYEVKIPEGKVTWLGYQALGQKHYEEAEYLFKLNERNYPESINAYDDLGTLYEAKGDKANAINSYSHALSLGEVGYIREKLNNLSKQ